MNVLWTSREAVLATGGRSTCDWQASGVSIDTRSIQEGDLFVALKDVRDGHDFVAQALEKGASAALVSQIPEGVSQDAPLLIVEDVLKALEDLGRAARARMQGQVIAVTGSVGKTSTKEMLRAALSGQGKTHAAERSFNNHWGVPLTLARMPSDTDFALIEMGMNHPGEIGPLSRMARPHVAMITAVAEVHMEAFRSVREIAKAKAEIFEGVEPGGTAVLNRDIPLYAILSRAAKRAELKQIRYGSAGRPEYAIRMSRIRGDGSVVTYRRDGQKYHLKLSAPGAHLAQNGLGVLAAVEAAGGDIALASMALANWQPPSGRGSQSIIDLGRAHVDGAITLIDESYNANPTSMEAALNGLSLSEPQDGVGRVSKGRRIAIIGDMLELGPQEIAKHSELAHLKALKKIDQIHTVGPLMEALHKTLPEAKRGRHFASNSDIAADVSHLLDAGDVVMVKASLGTGLGKVVDAIQALGHIRDANTTET